MRGILFSNFGVPRSLLHHESLQEDDDCPRKVQVSGSPGLRFPRCSLATRPFPYLHHWSSPTCLQPRSFSSRESRICPELQCTYHLHSLFFIDTEWKNVLTNRAIVGIMS